MPQWLNAFLRQRLQRHTLTGLPLTLVSMVFIYLLILFFGIVEDVVTSDVITAFDVRLENLLYLFRQPVLVKIFLWVTLLGKTSTILIISAANVLVWWIGKKKPYIIPYLIGLLGSSVCIYLGKIVFQRPRPLAISYYTEQTFSFPSGHATAAMFIFGFLTYFVWRNYQSRKLKLNIVFINLGIILAVGFSRLYLGVHFFSDILGGYLLGAWWLIIAISLTEWFLLRTNKTNKSITKLSAARRVAIVAIILSAFGLYGISGWLYHPAITESVVANS